MSNFLKVYQGLDLKPRDNDPANPYDGLVQFSDGTHRPKGLWEYFDGNWRRVGGGGLGGLDTFYIETFELTDVSDFVTGNNATPMVAGTFQGTLDYDTATPIAGENSLRYEQAAGSLNDWFASPEIPLERKQSEGGKTVQFNFRERGDNAKGNMRLFFVDADTDALLETYDSLDILQADNQQFSVAVYIPDGTQNIRWGWQVLVEDIGTTLTMDECEFKNTVFQVGEFDRLAVIDATGSGNFLSGTLKVSRIGNQVTLEMLQTFTHASLSATSSSIGFLPTWARPANSVLNCGFASPLAPNPPIISLNALPDGRFGFFYVDYNGVAITRTDAGSRATLSYIAQDEQTTTGIVSSTKMTFPSIYNLTTNQTAPTATQTTINFNTQDNDLNGLVTTGASWRWTAPRNGTIKAFAAAGVVGASDAIGDIYSLRVNKNGSDTLFLGRERVTDTTVYSKALQGTAYLTVEAGDEIYFELTHNTGSNRTIQSGNCSVTYTDRDFIGAFPMASEAGAGLVSYYNSVTIDMTGSGDFTSGILKVVRVGDHVTISSDQELLHPSLSTATSTVGVIPAWARPFEAKVNTYLAGGTRTYTANVDTDGTFIVVYRDYTGTPANEIETNPLTISYNV